jgi:transposase
MDSHQADAAEQAAGRATGQRQARAHGIFWVLRSGAPWRDVPDHFGPYTTCYNRFVRWRRAGVWTRIMNALAAAHDASVQMIDTSIVRVHQHGACIIRNRKESMGRSRGGLTSKIHAVVDTNGLPIRLALTAGEAHDNRLADKMLSRLKSGTMLLADRGYDADWIRTLNIDVLPPISLAASPGDRRKLRYYADLMNCFRLSMCQREI